MCLTLAGQVLHNGANLAKSCNVLDWGNIIVLLKAYRCRPNRLSALVKTFLNVVKD